MWKKRRGFIEDLANYIFNMDVMTVKLIKIKLKNKIKNIYSVSKGGRQNE